MSNPPFKIDVSQRITRLPPYLFGRINKMKYEKRVAGVDIIDLGMGNPTDPTPACVVDKLAEAAKDPRNHRYSVSNGIAGLRKEVAKKYKQKYGVEIMSTPEDVAKACDLVFITAVDEAIHGSDAVATPMHCTVGWKFVEASQTTGTPFAPTIWT